MYNICHYESTKFLSPPIWPAVLPISLFCSASHLLTPWSPSSLLSHHNHAILVLFATVRCSVYSIIEYTTMRT